MLKQEDLEAAVAQGIISGTQADALKDLASERRKPHASGLGPDERFKLLGGFNDFFVAIGVVLLGFGVTFGASTYSSPAAYLVGIFIMWGLAEYLTANLRLTAPSIVISIFLPVFAFLAAKGLTLSELQTPTPGLAVLATLAPLAMAALHYLRFRLPFSVAVVAITLLFFLLSLLGIPFNSNDSVVIRTTIFIYGLVVFAFAMWFDTSDTGRLTRRADKGFWLHLTAAPMIVHPLVTYLRGGSSGDGEGAIIVVALSIILATIALLIDRRALVVVSLSYLGGAIAYGVTQVSGADQSSTKVMFTSLFLGTIVIALGVGWHPIRNWLMHALPNFAFKQKLPPIN